MAGRWRERRVSDCPVWRGRVERRLGTETQ